MGGQWLLVSSLLLLTLMKTGAEMDALVPPAPSPPQDPASLRGPPAFPNSPPDVKTPETILQLMGSTQLSSCSVLQQLFSYFLDSANIFSRNQLCYVQLQESGSSDQTDQSSRSSGNLTTQSQNQTDSQDQQQQQEEVYWFILSAVLPNFDVADRAILMMGRHQGPDIDTFLASAGVPCGDELIATTQTEEQDTALVYIYSCNGMLTLPGSAVSMTLPSLCCLAKPTQPQQSSPPPPLPPSDLAGSPSPQGQPPSPLPPSPQPVASPPRALPPPPGVTDGAQLTLFVMAPPERLSCPKLLMACETLAQPYGLAYGNYSCRSSSNSLPTEARYGATAATTAMENTSSAAYVIVRAAWAPRAYSRSFRRLQSALASSIDVFASLGFVPCGTEIRALLLGTSGTVQREDAFGCISSLSDDYQTALEKLGLRVLPRQQLCCRPPPPPLPPPLPPPRPPPPPRQPPLSPPTGPSLPPAPFSPPHYPNVSPEPAFLSPLPLPSGPTLQPSPASGPTPTPAQSPVRPPGQPEMRNPGKAGGLGLRPPPTVSSSTTYDSAGNAAFNGKGSASQASKSVQAQGLTREAVTVIAVLSATVMVSLLGAACVLYRRRHKLLLSPRKRGPVDTADAVHGLPPIIGCRGDGVGGGGSPCRRQQHRQQRHSPQRGNQQQHHNDGKEGSDDAREMQLRQNTREGVDGGNGPGGLQLRKTASGSSSSLTECSSSSVGGIRALLDVSAAAAARDDPAGGDPYGGVSLGIHHADDFGDSVAVVCTRLHPGGQRLLPAPNMAQYGLPSAITAATQRNTLDDAAAVMAAVPKAGWEIAGRTTAPDASAFGLMDVFRGAAAHHLCLSTATSAAPSSAGLLTGRELLRNNSLYAVGAVPGAGSGSGAGGSNGGWPPGTSADRLFRRSLGGSDGASETPPPPWSGHPHRYLATQQHRRGDVAASAGDGGPQRDSAGQGGLHAVVAATQPTHHGSQQEQQPPLLGRYAADHRNTMALEEGAREVTLLELFNQSPLAGAILSTPSSSSGGAPPSPSPLPPPPPRSLPRRRLSSGDGVSGGAEMAARPPSFNPDAAFRQQRSCSSSSPAIALERLSVQLAWNIARLSCNMEIQGDPDREGEAAETQGGREAAGGGWEVGPPMEDCCKGARPLRWTQGHQVGGCRRPYSGPERRLPRWTGAFAMGPRDGGRRQDLDPTAVAADNNRSGEGSNGGGGSGPGTASTSASNGRSTGTSGTATTSSSSTLPSSDWGALAGLSARSSVAAAAAAATSSPLGPGAAAAAGSGGRGAAATEEQPPATMAKHCEGAAAVMAAPRIAARGAAEAKTGAGVEPAGGRGLAPAPRGPRAGAAGGGSGGGDLSPIGGGGTDLDISPKELRIHTDGLLGAGAFGSVYRGSYRGQPVAIKVLHHLHFAAAAAGGGGAAAAARGGGIGGGGGTALLQQKDVDSFRQEIAILRMLAHPNIVRVLGGCAHAGHPFLVMELMPRCLHNVIHGAIGLTLFDALRIATDVARGLAHLHPAIVHRDLKPANILLDANGTAKISDFGLARYHLKPYISTQQPDAGSVAYMAPEGFDPAIGRLSAKCDVYSFGVLLWELITQEHPWAGESNVAIIYRVAVHRMRLPVPIDPRVCPPRLTALLHACMSYLPSGRPDMSHVLSELESMLRLVQEWGVEALLPATSPQAEAPLSAPTPPASSSP